MSTEIKKNFYAEIELFDQSLRDANHDDVTNLEMRLEELQSSFETCKLEGRLQGSEVFEAEDRLENCRKVMLNLMQSQNKSSFSGYLFPGQQKLKRFFSSLTSQPSKQMEQAQSVAEMKKELLFSERQDTELRNRRNNDWRKEDDSLLHHQEMHETIASDMINLTKALKHNISSSGKIIRDDIKGLQQATKSTESNLSNLKTESTRLDAHMKKGSSWLWVCLFIVCATFMAMIIFIRFFPKPKR